MVLFIGCSLAVLTSCACALKAVGAYQLGSGVYTHLEEATRTSLLGRKRAHSLDSTSHVCDGAADPTKYGYGDAVQLASKQPVHGEERMAILLRGEAFHQSFTKQSGCVQAMYATQMRAAHSLMHFIVFPAERQNILVDIFVTDRKDCDMFADEVAVYRQGAERSVTTKILKTSSQATNIRGALDWFKQEAGGIDAIRDNYNLVIVTRHDLIWRSSFGSWPTANFSNFNFLSKGVVKEKEHINGDFQVNDVFHMMPGRVFPAFDATVGTRHCFNPDDEGSGHGCMCDMSNKVRSDHISFVTPWRPTGGVHDSSDVVEFPWGPDSALSRCLEYMEG